VDKARVLTEGLLADHLEAGRVSMHVVSVREPPVEDDPERCSYQPLDPELDRRVRERFTIACEATAARLGHVHIHVALESVSKSFEHNADGHLWLKFLATDGTTWYLGWRGDSAEATSSAEEFGEMIAESLGDESGWE
jgi:hypothetical protein